MGKNNRQQAKRMAEKGRTAAQIQAKTGVGSSHANRYVERHAPTPAPAARPSPAPSPTPNGQGPAGNTASPTNPGISASPSRTTPTRSNPSRSTPEVKGVGQGLRVAGENGISRRDFNTIAEAKGKSPEKIIGKLDKINTKLETKGKAGIDLKSGAANMLLKKGQKSPPKYRGFGADSKASLFGDGAIGSALQSMMPTPANAGTWIKGQLTGGREADPGFNPGGKADKNRMIGGTVLRPDGKIAVKGAGEQYELPKRFKGEEEVVDEEKDPIVEEEKDPIVEQEEDPIEEIPEPEEEEVDRSASSGAGGLDLASWATGFRKARSARQKSGRPGQGLASQKKNPFKSWA